MPSTLESFASGALGSCFASTFTNPVEVVKTRMQLQGELASQGHSVRIYHGLLQSLALIGKNEGIRGLQKGLVSAYWYQTTLNGVRLGLYEPARQQMNRLFGIDPTVHNYPIGILTGALSGALGSIPASPFYLVKVRMQSYSPVFTSVGDQTHIRSIWGGLRSIVRENGVPGLWQGVGSAALKLTVISAAHMPTYNYTKTILEPVVGNEHMLYLAASSMSGLVGAIVVNPFDVVMTRLYNQTHRSYTGITDCFHKIVRYEGPLALYKGFAAAGLRSAGQNVLTLMAMEWIFKAFKRL